MNTLNKLIDDWRAEAAVCRRRGSPIAADALESCAADLVARLREMELESITLEEAAAESGYSYSALQKKVASGDLTNVGKRGAPRVRRGELPKKANPTRRSAVPNLVGDLLLRRVAR
jgi:hypothetical protein